MSGPGPTVYPAGFIGPRLAIDELATELGTIAAMTRQMDTDSANAASQAAECDYKPLGVFVPGDRVVMRGAALMAAGCLSGSDCARVWKVVECSCDLCQQASDRLVAVDQEVDGYGWRHIGKSAIRHYWQPTVDELSAQQTDDQRGWLHRGLRIAQQTRGL